MFETFTVLFDANVLYPPTLRSLLMHLALTDLFRARWTDAIHEEWIRNVLTAHPDILPEALAKTRRLMDAHVAGALITGYDDLIPALSLPDPNDRHVLAAAIRGGANVIVTCNTKDFPDALLDQYGIEAQHPDIFITHLFDLAPMDVLAAARNQLRDLKNPPVSVSDYLERLEKLQLPQTAGHLRQYQEFLL